MKHITQTYVVGVLYFGRCHITNVSHGLQWWLVKERRFTVHHLNNHNTKRPDIHLRKDRQSVQKYQLYTCHSVNACEVSTQ